MEYDRIHTAETTDTSYKHIIRYTGIFGGVQSLKIIVSMVRNKLTTYILGSVGLGLISVYNTISDFVVSCSNFGLPINATRETSEVFETATQEHINRLARVIRSWAIWTSIFAAFVCALLSPVLSYFFFDDKDYSRFPEVLLLIPVVVTFIISEAECSILKGLRQLRRVATLETFVAIAILFLTVPSYYLWGMRGVIVALNVSSIASCIIHLYFSVPVVPYQVSLFSKSVFREGLPMMRRGVPFMMAGIVNTATTMIVIWMIKKYGMLSDVGYYRAGFTIMVAYAGLVFTAIEADYFPRLTSVNHNKELLNRTINQQIHVCVTLVTPFLIALLLMMPIVIQILYKEDFLVLLPMTFVASYFIFLRAIMLPISYTTLAKGDAIIFMVLDVFSDLVLLLSMWYFYTRFGLMGSGLALSVNALYDLLIALIVCGVLYGCRLTKQTWKLSAMQFVMLTFVFCCCMQPVAWLKYTLCPLILCVSVYISWRVLKSKAKQRE